MWHKYPLGRIPLSQSDYWDRAGLPFNLHVWVCGLAKGFIAFRCYRTCHAPWVSTAVSSVSMCPLEASIPTRMTVCCRCEKSLLRWGRPGEGG